ncbi:MAG: class I SAM-dependent DNA methyltransferase [Chloroflexi bacterium]|nr:class I SAM-dependent DNA methyltransferase [Chloroflexota bacterium]
MDKTGETFTYQKGVTKSITPFLKPPKRARKSKADEKTLPLLAPTPAPAPSQSDDQATEGGRGYADVWFRRHFAVEYKTAGKHKDLTAAYRQLLFYKDALENPPLLVVCDIEHFEIHTNFTNTETRVYKFTNADIASPRSVPGSRFTAVQILDKLFHDPEGLRPEKTVEAVTREAADKFAQLADSMHHKHNVPYAQAARFLVKLVFCLFCEDVGLLPAGIFSRIVAATQDSPREFTRHVRDLFGAMATGGRIVWGEPILHFDGGLFSDADGDPDVVPFDGADTRLLVEAATLNWADVDPSIFGTLFERALDVEGKRAQLGAHYTSRADIETLVEPVLMAPLRREWEEVKDAAAGYLGWRFEKKEVESSKQKAELERLLKGFQEKLVSTTVLDPACGSGNFLYVSLSMLKDLEKQVITFGLDVGLPDLEPRVTPIQLRGLEKDDFAFQLASIVVWIGYLQWKVKNGYAPAGEQPILKPLDTIKQMDAVLEIPKAQLQGTARQPQKPKEPEWPAAEVIVGNPPFLGGNRIRAVLSDEYVDALFKLYEGRVPAFSDLCCYWFEKARAMIAEAKAKRAGLLATNSIRGGVNREALKRIKESGDIFWAISDRDWILDGAAVNVSMIGFDDNSEKLRVLDDLPVSIVNSDLTASFDLTQARRLKENLGICFYGSQQKGSFEITPAKAREFLSKPNPFGRDPRDVVKRSINAMQILRRTDETWVIDFGVDMPMEEAALYEAPFEHVKKVVYPERRNRNEKIQREYWWLHARPSPRYRGILKKQKRYIASPIHAKYRVFVWLNSDVLADHAVVVFARDDDYTFGVLHSKVHELWALRLGTSLEDRPRYTPTTTFETFPFPRPTPKQKEAIAEAARELNEKREHWLNPYKDQPSAIREDLKKRTLTNLYNERPTWLQLAHERLDHAVLDAYSWPHDISDDEILARLLEENLKREAVGGGSKADVADEESDEGEAKPKRQKKRRD